MKKMLSIAVFMIFLGGIVSGLFAQEKINIEFPSDIFDKWHPDSLVQKRDVSTTNWYEPEIITAYSLSGEKYRLVNEYDSRGFMTKSTKQTEYLGFWIDSESTEYFYSGDLLSSFITQLVRGGILIDYQRGLYYYNAGNHLIESHYELWSDNIQNWRISILRSYEYASDFTDKLIEEFYTTHNYSMNESGIEMESITHFKYDYRYNNQDKLSEKTWRQQLSDESWENRESYLFGYHENGKTESVIEQEWDKTAWRNKFRTFIEYDSQKRKKLEHRQHWYGMDWMNARCHEYSYNDEGQLRSDTYKTWYINDWINVSKEDYTYHNNDITVVETYTWFGSRWWEEYIFEYEYDSHHNALKGLAYAHTTDSWEEADLTILMRYNDRKSSYSYENSYKVETTYQEAQEPLNRIEDLENSYSAYPNPTNGTLRIKNEELRMNHIRVFDITGRLIHEVRNINNTEFVLDMSDFAAGVYLVNVDEKTVKVVKQ